MQGEKAGRSVVSAKADGVRRPREKNPNIERWGTPYVMVLNSD